MHSHAAETAEQYRDVRAFDSAVPAGEPLDAHNAWIVWDEKVFNVKQPEMRQYLRENYGVLWKLEV